jgi:hypothetical protein
MASGTNELNRRSRTAATRRGAGEPDVIQAEIERTRVQMGQTIEQIQDRLSPARLRQETEDTIREATIGKVEQMTDRAEREVRNWRRKVAYTMKENPVPTALIGIGVGWLILSDDDRDHYYATTEEYHYYPYADRYEARAEGVNAAGEVTQESREWARERASRARSRASTAADKVQDRASDVAGTVQERVDETTSAAQRQARELGHQVKETGRQARRRARRNVRRSKRTFWENMNENPLAVGATALAMGALIGLALPSTPPEDRWMGERRDELLDEARTRAQERAQDVRAVAREAKDAAVKTAKTEAEKRDLPAPSADDEEPVR